MAQLVVHLCAGSWSGVKSGGGSSDVLPESPKVLPVSTLLARAGRTSKPHNSLLALLLRQGLRSHHFEVGLKLTEICLLYAKCWDLGCVPNTSQSLLAFKMEVLEN